ncbi:lecithin retinol acyltransferase family protein [Pseudomonas putida]
MHNDPTRLSASDLAGFDGARWPVGTHLVCERPGYLHHGIYAGNGRVIHYAGLCDFLRYGPIEEVSLSHFAGHHDVWSMAQPESDYRSQQVIARARGRIGECRYKLLTNNCEHFCTWCLYGKARSEQVRRFWVNPFYAMRLIRHLIPTLLGCVKRPVSQV